MNAQVNSTMTAVVVDSSDRRRLVLKEVARPQPSTTEMLVRVQAISLNRGETRMALKEATDGWRPGWDVAGIVEQPAADGPATGTRVVCTASSAGWAEFIAVPPASAATIPDNVSCEQAASLPVAALTARRALQLAGPLKGRNVLISGASGGVGTFALQLAHLQEARVVGAIRSKAQEALVRRLGADEVGLGDNLAGAATFGPYDLILESVGGQSLAAALSMLAPGGVCVLLGASAGSNTTFDAAKFRVGGTSLYGLVMGFEFRREPPGVGLGELVRLVAEQKLRPEITVTGHIGEIAEVAAKLLERGFVGKAVLKVP
ncbi:zinc-binding dehydrogenase [Bradyrhizobium sp. LHD-71]|uniref:zinc-binding dehydrogenase n=1 Tax=Bradyrhizobium sp. LHD-71 TaxID=3072141 RepID=UPI00280F32A5|nr:zinc-binding dehydrogenase [Bradyrhizobium sp. LHD-71]MDQ8728937.1 zinc-binding dehydrogenase [Bradyrhizobium sp. LHD-71]